jgi:mitotic spindle assembly checkpoint protein MAD2B
MAGAIYIETLNAFKNFLTAYIHTLLYLRSLYPRTLFVHSRFHNASAYQLRHPLVCD